MKLEAEYILPKVFSLLDKIPSSYPPLIIIHLNLRNFPYRDFRISSVTAGHVRFETHPLIELVAVRIWHKYFSRSDGTVCFFIRHFSLKTGLSDQYITYDT